MLVISDAHRGPPRPEHLHQARPVVAGGGDRVRLRARPRLSRLSPRGAERTTRPSGGEWSIRAMRPPRPLRTFDPMTDHRHQHRSTDEPTRADAAFNRCFETFDAGEGLFADDAFFDLLPAVLAVPAPGPGGLRPPAPGDRRGRADRSRRCASCRRPPGSSWSTRRAAAATDPEVARRLWLCKVRDGRIAEAVGYCNGGWDDDAARTARRRGADAAAMGDRPMSTVRTPTRTPPTSSTP